MKWLLLGRLVRDEQGTALVLTAILLLVLLGSAALAVDLGLLYGARTEAQRTADASAHGGAVYLAQNPGDDDGAEATAREYAAANLVLGENGHVVDVTVDLTDETVKADIFRTRDRAVSIPTLFARILGIDEADVATSATAKVFPAGAVFCPLPLALPDRWWEDRASGRKAGPDDSYDPETDDDDGVADEYYLPGDPRYAGYTSDDFGTTLQLASGSGGGGEWNASWYFGWAPPGHQGGADFRANIAGCENYDDTFALGDGISRTEPGAKVGPVNQGFRALLGSDIAEWRTDENPNYVWSSSCGRNCSPRIRPIPFFDPTTLTEPGRKEIRFTNFAAFFVEGQNADGWYGRLMHIVGRDPITDPSGAETGTLRAVAIIE